MSRALIVTKEAEADILDGYLSYEEKQRGLGLRFVDEIEFTLDRIIPNPFLYQEVEPDIRRAVAHTFLIWCSIRLTRKPFKYWLSFMRLKIRLTSMSGLAPNKALQTDKLSRWADKEGHGALFGRNHRKRNLWHSWFF